MFGYMWLYSRCIKLYNMHYEEIKRQIIMTMLKNNFVHYSCSLDYIMLQVETQVQFYLLTSYFYTCKNRVVFSRGHTTPFYAAYTSWIFRSNRSCGHPFLELIVLKFRDDKHVDSIEGERSTSLTSLYVSWY